MKIQKITKIFSLFSRYFFLALLTLSFSCLSGISNVNAGTGSDSDGGAEGDVGGFGGVTGCGNNLGDGGSVQGDGGGGGTPTVPTCGYNTAWCNSIGFDVANATVCGWCECTGSRTYTGDASDGIIDGRGGVCTDPAPVVPAAPTVEINFSLFDKIKIFFAESFITKVFAAK